METKKLILALIKDDMINAKLINSLTDIGIPATDYLLHLSQTIFELMGFEKSLQSDMIRDHYFELIRGAKYIDFAVHPKLLNLLALEVYEYLDAVSPKVVNNQTSEP